MLVAFRIVLWLAAASFFIPAGLLTASLFMADLGPQSAAFTGVSVAVSVLFLAAGLLILGIQFRTVAIAKLRIEEDGPANAHLDRHLSFLAAYLMISAAALCVIMTTVIFAILVRLNEGYAVFG